MKARINQLAIKETQDYRINVREHCLCLLLLSLSLSLKKKKKPYAVRHRAGGGGGGGWQARPESASGTCQPAVARPRHFVPSQVPRRRADGGSGFRPHGRAPPFAGCAVRFVVPPIHPFVLLATPFYVYNSQQMQLL